MSLHPHRNDPIPEETVRIARTAYPKGNVYLRMRDELGVLFEDEAFSSLFSLSGQSAHSPGRLALVTLMQFAEHLTDRQAAEAVRGRIDWKYALGLTLTDAGFDYSVLSEFRSRLIAHSAEEVLLNTLLETCRARGWVKAGGPQRTDSTHVLAAVRELNRLECVGETVRQTLEVLVDVVPGWLRGWLSPEWVVRYAQPMDSFRLPKDVNAREQLGQVIGADGYVLLCHLYADSAPRWLREVPAVETLRRVWVQQYEVRDEQVCWRADKDLPPAQELIGSPFDADARTSTKRDLTWNGYKVHLTETCEPDAPHLVTNVITTPATVPDVAVTPQVHDDLAAKDLFPRVHVVDGGYTDAAELAHAQAAHQIELLGPMRASTSWQAQAAQGYALEDFHIDWAAQEVTCPQGQHTHSWTTQRDHHGTPRITVKFPAAVCRACPARALCTRGAEGVRKLSFQPEAEYRALQAARAYQATPEFKARYTARAGIEGTLSQGIAALGLRFARYWGLAKTRLQHLLTATALDYLRMADWLMAVPRAATRKSKLKTFAALASL
jgi:transposase